MKLIFWLSLCAAVLAVVLAAAAWTRVHLTKVTTEQAVASIERSVIRREALSHEQLRRLDFDLGHIRGNDRGQQRVESELRRVAVTGFLALAAINAALAAFAWSWSREPKTPSGRRQV